MAQSPHFATLAAAVASRRRVRRSAIRNQTTSGKFMNPNTPSSPVVARVIRSAVALAVAVTLVACGGGGDDDQLRTYEGASQPLGQGSARSWVTLDAQDRPQAIGITLTESALQGLPANPVAGPAAAELNLTLPGEAAATGIDHVTVEWNPQGHEPDPIYGVGHFDFHFYRITEGEQNAILPSDPDFATKAARFPALAYVPAGYVPPPGDPAANTVPQMGLHWVDPTSPEFNGKPFTSTFIHGEYDGRFTFMEPMVAKSFLDTKPDYVRDLPQPAKWAVAGYYPTRYRVGYDAQSKVYRIVLDGLVRRDAS
jgi:Domain of unknown function (DUF5602)